MNITFPVTPTDGKSARECCKTSGFNVYHMDNEQLIMIFTTYSTSSTPIVQDYSVGTIYWTSGSPVWRKNIVVGDGWVGG